MACSCMKRKEVHAKSMKTENVESIIVEPQPEQKTLPTEQCIACCQKHMDEAWCLFNEYGYSNENRRFIRGNLRAIVLHSFKEWKNIAEQARKCALLVQEVKDDEALEEMRKLCDMIDDEFYNVNPEIKERIDKKMAKN